MIEIDDMRAFVDVVDTGGFSRAAERLGVSKSVVSRRIARLEAELGASLITRSTRGVAPTEAGAEFKARAASILAELDAAQEAVARHGTEVAGRLRIAAPLSFGVRHVAPLLAELSRQHPRLEIDAAYSDRHVDLVGEGFDVAVRIGALKDSSLVARRVAPVHGAVIASPAYLAAHGTPKVPADLAAHSCIVYTASSPEWRFRTGRRWSVVRPQGRLKADSGDAILAWAIEGAGCAALPTFLCSDAIRDGLLVPVLADFPLPESALHVVRPPATHVSRKVRVVTDAVVARFATDTTWDPCRLAEASRQAAARISG